MRTAPALFCLAVAFAMAACSAPPSDPPPNQPCLSMGNCNPPGAMPDLLPPPAASLPDLMPMVDPCKEYYSFPVDPPDKKWVCWDPKGGDSFYCKFRPISHQGNICTLVCPEQFTCPMDPKMMGAMDFTCTTNDNFARRCRLQEP